MSMCNNNKAVIIYVTWFMWHLQLPFKNDSLLHKNCVLELTSIHYSGQEDGIDSIACIVAFTPLVLGSYLKKLA